MATVLFKRGNTATINGTAITDGQLLYDTTTGRHYEDVGSTRIEVGKPVDSTLSTTSTNAIQNKAITNSIINTTAEVSAITASNIPCGTLPVKELITSLNGLTTNLTNYINVVTGTVHVASLGGGSTLNYTTTVVIPVGYTCIFDKTKAINPGFVVNNITRTGSTGTITVTISVSSWYTSVLSGDITLEFICTKNI